MTLFCSTCGKNLSLNPSHVCASTAHTVYNTNTRKLIPTGAAHRDRLVAARLNLRRVD